MNHRKSNMFIVNLNPLMPGICSTSDVITFDQDGYHLYSSSVGGKDLSSDMQIKVTGSIEPEICTKMLRNFSQKLGAKFLLSTLGHSMVRISCLDDTFLEILELEASPEEGQPLQRSDKKRRGKEIKMKINTKI